MKTTFSTNEFNNHLIDSVRTVCKDNQLVFDKDKDRGEAFSIWCVELLKNINNLEDDSEDILMGGSSDLKIDFVLQDETEKIIYLVQTKFVSMGKRAKKRGDVNIDDLEIFSQRHEKLKDATWLREKGNQTIAGKLADYKELVEDGFKFNFLYITTANATERADEIIKEQNLKYEDLKEEVNIELIDFTRLKEIYTNSLSSDQAIPEIVSFDIPEDKFIIKEEPRKTLLAIVKGSSIINLYKQHRKGIFTWNIRGHLGGDKGINKNIKKTALENPEDFYYYNNGISAVCTGFDVEGNKLTANKFQIINGAQTVGSLFLARDKASNSELLLKVTVSGSVSTEKGFNADIIKFNNTQNKVNLSDFRSNDKIQELIEKNFSKTKATSVNGIIYLRKRGIKKKAGMTNITLESLARIRYGYLHNPCDVISNAKSLWDNEKNGRYNKAFGFDDEIPEIIAEDNFNKTFVLPVCLYEFIEDECKEKSKDEAFKDLKRFKFHLLSLSRILLDHLLDKQKDSVNISKLIKDSKYMKVFVNKFLKDTIPIITDMINSAYVDIKEGKSISINAPLRDLQINRNKWNNMVKNFETRLKLMTNKEIKDYCLK